MVYEELEIKREEEIKMESLEEKNEEEIIFILMKIKALFEKKMRK